MEINYTGWIEVPKFEASIIFLQLLSESESKCVCVS